MEGGAGRQEGAKASSRPTFHPLGVPRIRDLSGIRIQQLTLPDALPFAAKLLPDHVGSTGDAARHEGYSLGESSTYALSSSPDAISFAARRGSNASRLSVSYVHAEGNQRTRSTSISTIGPHSSLAHRPRTTRSRAPTLAGEALEQAQLDETERQDSLQQVKEEEIVKPRRIARSFVVLRLCDPPRSTESLISRPRHPLPTEDYLQSQTNGSSDTSRRRTVSRSSSTVSVRSPPTSPLHARPPLSSHPSRSRTTSLNPPSPVSTAPGLYRTPSSSNIKERRPLHRTASGRSHLVRQNSLDPTMELPSKVAPVSLRPDNVPFYVSGIHHASAFPRWCYLETRTDLADWLTAEEAASTRFRLEVWYEDLLHGSPQGERWRKLDSVDREIRLADLDERKSSSPRTENQIELTFATHPKTVYIVPNLAGEVSAFSGHPQSSENGDFAHSGSTATPVQPNRSQDRARKGLGFGGLHELVNVQAVIADMERNIASLQARIDQLLSKDVDHRAIKRDIGQRTANISWLQDHIADVERRMKEIAARTVLRTESIANRQNSLQSAAAQSDRLQAHALNLDSQITEVENERILSEPILHHWRSHHAQTLDSLFPIQPLDPSSLLYSILNVPLPIPTGPKDPAPPLSLPASMLPDGVRIDERTTAAALGYAALVVQILGNLGGVQGGLPYPITGAGSRSLVKDIVSVMQGPRSFPLYSKGVERYRYEYAVFLLNKNVETLMTETNIRLLDLRHTLPNLKNLLLTLSSDVMPPPARLSVTSSTYFDSRPTSRQTSNAWSLAQSTSPGSSTGRQSPVSDKRTTGLQLSNTPSPLTKASGSFVRRSRLSRPSMPSGTRTDEAGGSDEEGSESVTADEGENEKTVHPTARGLRNHMLVYEGRRGA